MAADSNVSDEFWQGWDRPGPTAANSELLATTPSGEMVDGNDGSSPGRSPESLLAGVQESDGEDARDGEDAPGVD